MNFTKNLGMNIKIFNYCGAPVYVSAWILILLFFIKPIILLGLFVSVIIHEMAHTYIATKKGYKIDKITIGVLYGGTHHNNNIHERDDIPIILAGPISNLILTMLLAFIYIITNNDNIFTLFGLNLILFLFNILPIYPMDGGQALRAYLRIKNRRTYKKTSAKISLITSILLFIIAIVYTQFLIILFAVYFIIVSLFELKIFKY